VPREDCEALGLGVEEAAAIIRKMWMKTCVGHHERSAPRGYSPEEFILFAAGGAGPTHVEVSALQIQRLSFPVLTGVLCLGIVTMDIMHVYEHSRSLR